MKSNPRVLLAAAWFGYVAMLLGIFALDRTYRVPDRITPAMLTGGIAPSLYWSLHAFAGLLTFTLLVAWARVTKRPKRPLMRGAAVIVQAAALMFIWVASCLVYSLSLGQYF